MGRQRAARLKRMLGGNRPDTRLANRIRLSEMPTAGEAQG